MGTWSTSNFGNDTALDFVAEMRAGQNLAQTFKINTSKQDCIELDHACEILAAAEIVAATLNRPSIDLPNEVAENLTSFDIVNSDLIEMATIAIRQVQSHSELRDLWQESDAYADWLNATNDLLTRLDLSNDYTPPKPEFIEPAKIGAVCYLCRKDIDPNEEVELTASSDDGILVSMTLYADRDCLQRTFNPPHFNADGSPHADLLEQFKKSQDIDL